VGTVIRFPQPEPAPEPARVPPGPAETFAELTRAGDQAEALVIRGLLEAHGIQVVLRTRLAPSVHPFSVGDQAVVQILVPPAALTAGRRLLAPPPPGRSARRT
jgi:hypothetical protein